MVGREGWESTVGKGRIESRWSADPDPGCAVYGSFSSKLSIELNGSKKVYHRSCRGYKPYCDGGNHFQGLMRNHTAWLNNVMQFHIDCPFNTPDLCKANVHMYRGINLNSRSCGHLWPTALFPGKRIYCFLVSFFLMQFLTPALCGQNSGANFTSPPQHVKVCVVLVMSGEMSDNSLTQRHQVMNPIFSWLPAQSQSHTERHKKQQTVTSQPSNSNPHLTHNIQI